MSQNISFENCRRKLLAGQFTDKIMQDARIQKELHNIYNFNSINQYKLFLSALFYKNHKIKEGHNPNAGFLVGFNPDIVEYIVHQIESALKSIGRKYIVIEANEKTFIECINPLVNKNHNTSHDAFLSLKEILLNSDKVVVFKEFSKCKWKTNKGSMVRGIIKILDDAHIKGIRPISDLLFVDYASFLEKNWDYVSTYIKITL